MCNSSEIATKHAALPIAEEALGYISELWSAIQRPDGQEHTGRVLPRSFCDGFVVNASSLEEDRVPSAAFGIGSDRTVLGAVATANVANQAGLSRDDPGPRNLQAEFEAAMQDASRVEPAISSQAAGRTAPVLAEVGDCRAPIPLAASASAAALSQQAVDHAVRNAVVNADGSVTCPVPPWDRLGVVGKLTMWPESEPPERRSMSMKCCIHRYRCSFAKHRSKASTGLMLKWLFSAECPEAGAQKPVLIRLQQNNRSLGRQLNIASGT